MTVSGIIKEFSRKAQRNQDNREKQQTVQVQSLATWEGSGRIRHHHKEAQWA
jgi:hypothetical protein